MLSEAALLAVEVHIPESVVVRRVTSEADVCAMAAMQDEVFGRALGPDWLLRRVAEDPSIELWVAQSGTKVVSAVWRRESA